MKWRWPWVSRATLEGTVDYWEGLANRCLSEGEHWKAQAADYKRALEIEKALRRDEQWRRIKAEGHLAYMQDRVVKARDMMLSSVAAEEPTAKRKAIPE